MNRFTRKFEIGLTPFSACRLSMRRVPPDSVGYSS